MTRTEKWADKRNELSVESKIIRDLFILDKKEELFKSKAREQMQREQDTVFSVKWDGTK